jgi:DNA (cytosine-5)-methyltransferase 3A
MNVLSLFDGISCGQVALERAGIHVDNYFASEIDKYAISITQKNYPHTIQLGDVRNVKARDLPKIDLIIGGSPCQGFSFAGKQLNFKDPRSELFFEFVRLVKECKPEYFLLENVIMKQEYQNVISAELGINPIIINSALVSAQNRERLYWTNIEACEYGLFGECESNISQPLNRGIMLKDILEKEVDKKYFIKEETLKNLTKHKERHEKAGNGFGISFNYEDKKANTLTVGGNYMNDLVCLRVANINNGAQGQRVYNPDFKSVTLSALGGGQGAKTGLYEVNEQIRRLTPIECERLQTLPDNYTAVVSNTQRYKALGNGWTVDVIAHIFSYLPYDKLIDPQIAEIIDEHFMELI